MLAPDGCCSCRAATPACQCGHELQASAAGGVVAEWHLHTAQTRARRVKREQRVALLHVAARVSGALVMISA